MRMVSWAIPVVALAALVTTGCVSGQRQMDLEPPPVRHTLKDLRDMNVVKQERDYSCGSAALATLLVYYFGHETSEGEVLDLLLSSLSETEKQQKVMKGFSLLDLKEAARKMGFRAAGFRLKATDLPRLGAPVLVHVEPGGYKHFAVLRGVDRGRVHLADPARGNLRMSLDKFADEWTGIVFAVARDGEEDIEEHALLIPDHEDVLPEWRRLNAQLDLGTLLMTLPFR